jgi:WD40 repeat protein
MINSLAFSPDGKTLATASLDRTIKLWDAVTGKDLATLKGHTDGLYSVAFSPDGMTLATAGRDRTVKVWDVTTQKATRILRHTGIVECVAFSPDGKFLAAGDWAGNVIVRETKGWQVTASKVTFPVTCLAFSPDGRNLAVGGKTGTLTLWNPSSRDPSTTFSTPQDILRTVSFSPDGNTLVTGSHNGRVLSWNVAWLKPPGASR